MKNGVECYKDFFPYFKALKTNCVLYCFGYFEGNIDVSCNYLLQLEEFLTLQSNKVVIQNLCPIDVTSTKKGKKNPAEFFENEKWKEPDILDNKPKLLIYIQNDIYSQY